MASTCSEVRRRGGVASFASTVALLLGALLPRPCEAGPESHLVSHLPGLDGDLPSALFSGFLVSGEHRVHYMLAESQGDPASDPLVLWFNGGPGSSSLIGFFQELGPVVVANNETLVRNPYAWSSIANVLYFESPTGVGYSSCQASRGGGKCEHNDQSTAQLNLDSLSEFLRLFPEYSGRDFMIWGESYAGVYIPMLADLVFESGLLLNFQGFSVGDPCTAERYQKLDDQLHFNLQFALSRGFIDSRTHDFIYKHCVQRDAIGNKLTPDYTRPGCRRAWRVFFIATSSDDGYTDTRAHLPHGGFIDPYTTYGPNAHDFDKAMKEYLNWEPVKAALHTEGIEWGRQVLYTKQYQACFYEEDTDPSRKPEFDRSMIPIYRKLAGKLRTIVVFNGDTDPDVQFQGTEDAVAAVGLPLEAGGAWRPWFYRQTPTPMGLLRDKPPFWGAPLSHHPLPGAQLGGYVTDYKGSLSFVTVHGSGHMVPMFQPQAALHFFSRVLKGQRMAPALDLDHVDSDTDEAFFGKGYMREWVKAAQSHEFTTPGLLGTADGGEGTHSTTADHLDPIEMADDVPQHQSLRLRLGFQGAKTESTHSAAFS